MKELRKPSSDLVTRCGNSLHNNGWRREIAGENFSLGANAFANMVENRIGIFVRGGLGVGKSTFFRAIAQCTLNGLPFRYLNLKDPLDATALDRFDHLDEFTALMNGHVILDDFGAEAPTTYYGTKIEPALDFALSYICRGKGTISIGTNLDPKQLLERYSSRLDCLKEGLMPITFGGDNRRQWMLPL